MDKGLTEDKIKEVENYEVSESLTRREMGLEHQSIDDKFFGLLHEEFSDAEIAEMSIVISVCIGWGRLLSVFKVEEA